MAKARSRKENSGKGLLFFGLVLGAAIGAAVALVYSPNKGEENRRNLSTWAAHRAEDAKNRAQSALPGSRQSAPGAQSNGPGSAPAGTTGAAGEIS